MGEEDTGEGREGGKETSDLRWQSEPETRNGEDRSLKGSDTFLRTPPLLLPANLLDRKEVVRTKVSKE